MRRAKVRPSMAVAHMACYEAFEREFASMWRHECGLGGHVVAWSTEAACLHARSGHDGRASQSVMQNLQLLYHQGHCRPACLKLTALQYATATGGACQGQEDYSQLAGQEQP